MKHKVIEDYYGTETKVTPSVFSERPFVYVSRRRRHPRCIEESTDSYTPEQARNLATQLNEAADEIDPSGVES